MVILTAAKSDYYNALPEVESYWRATWRESARILKQYSPLNLNPKGTDEYTEDWDSYIFMQSSTGIYFICSICFFWSFSYNSSNFSHFIIESDRHIMQHLQVLCTGTYEKKRQDLFCGEKWSAIMFWIFNQNLKTHNHCTFGSILEEPVKQGHKRMWLRCLCRHMSFKK